MIADVIAWAGGDDGERWDVVVANLFLHHFDGDALRRLLAACARRADALAACEPRRSRFALAASHLIFFLGANAVTRHDGVLSVRAGFVDRELGAAWPDEPRGVAPRRIRRRPVHALPGRRAAADAVMTTRFDVAIVGAGPAGAARRSCWRAPAGRSR